MSIYHLQQFVKARTDAELVNLSALVEAKLIDRELIDFSDENDLDW